MTAKPPIKPTDAVPPPSETAEIVPLARALMRRGLRKPVRQVALPAVSSGSVGSDLVLEREAGWSPVPDLSGRPQVVMAWGGGGSGKTVLGRRLASLWADRGVLAQASFVAADPGARLLPQFVPNVEQPKAVPLDRMPAEIAVFLEEYLDWWSDPDGGRPRLGFADMGGNNAAAEAAMRRRHSVWRRVAESGAEVVQVYCMTPRVADLALPLAMEAAGWAPRATAFVLNMGKADRGLASFDELRGQDGYRALLARGAVELVMPRLEERVAQEVEGALLPFHHARDGRAPKGWTSVPVDEDTATVVAEWLRDSEAALAPVLERGWLG